MSSGFNPLQAAENPYDRVGAALAPLMAAVVDADPALYWSSSFKILLRTVLAIRRQS